MVYASIDQQRRNLDIITARPSSSDSRDGKTSAPRNTWIPSAHTCSTTHLSIYVHSLYHIQLYRHQHTSPHISPYPAPLCTILCYPRSPCPYLRRDDKVHFQCCRTFSNAARFCKEQLCKLPQSLKPTYYIHYIQSIPHAQVLGTLNSILKYIMKSMLLYISVCLLPNGNALRLTHHTQK